MSYFLYRGILLTTLVALVTAVASPVRAQTSADHLRGRILLQVERSGEAWYVLPEDGTRIFMGRPEDAFAVMRSVGVGISSADLRKIPVGGAVGADLSGDSDGDGYSDMTEIVNNYDPYGPGKLPIDEEFTRKQLGKIFLQVEQNGEAWYVNPVDQKRYFLGRPADAFALMRGLGLGITDKDLDKIPLSKREITRVQYEEPKETLLINLVPPDEQGEESISMEESASVQTVAQRWSGKIARDASGILWYINPADEKRYRIGASEAAFDALTFFADYALSAQDDFEIPPVAHVNFTADDSDTDGDGLGDTWEDVLGLDKEKIDSDDDGIIDLEQFFDSVDDADSDWESSLDRTEGRILYSPMGTAYVPPDDGHSYFFLGPEGAQTIVDMFAQTIAGADLAAIPLGDAEGSTRCGVVKLSTSLESSFDLFSSTMNMGDVRSVASGQVSADCFERKFKLCEPAEVITITSIPAFASEATKHRIVGGQNGACAVELTDLQSYQFGSVTQETLGKSMMCAWEQSDVPAVTRSVTVVQKDGTYGVDAACHGEAADILRESLAGLQGAALSMRVLKKGMYRGVKKESVVILSTQEELDAFWPIAFPLDAKPTVTFREDVLYLFFSERGTTDMTISRVAEYSYGTRIVTAVVTAGDSCGEKYDAQPYVAVAVPKGEDIGTPVVQMSQVNGLCPSNAYALSEVDRTYTNSTYGFSVLLPDRVKNFVIKETREPAGTDSIVTITFNQHSAIEGKEIEQFSLSVIPQDRWKDVDENGLTIRDEETGEETSDWVSSLGETGAHVIAERFLWNFSLPADVGGYLSDELEFRVP